MSDEHKEALAEGREQGRAVRAYLEALEVSKPRRGRRRTPASIETRLAAIEERFAGADALTRLHLAQEQLDLQAELGRLIEDDGADLQTLEDRFVKVAAAYGARKGISRGAWLSAGVSRKVLDRADI